MMHEGYFVGRKELINWIRAYFEPGFSKIEDLANGVVYCQIIDNIYPGAVPMSKVKTTAKTEVDFIHNFKVPLQIARLLSGLRAFLFRWHPRSIVCLHSAQILQTAFGKKKIDRCAWGRVWENFWIPQTLPLLASAIVPIM